MAGTQCGTEQSQIYGTPLGGARELKLLAIPGRLELPTFGLGMANSYRCYNRQQCIKFDVHTRDCSDAVGHGLRRPL
jgi:hypothetical protein